LKLADGEAGIGNDPPERPLSDLAMIGDDHAGGRVVAAQDHVAAALAAEHETSPFQRRAHLATGQAGGKPGHDARGDPITGYAADAASTSTNSFPASVGIGSPASRQSSI